MEKEKINILKGLPKRLKDVKNFEKIIGKLSKILQNSHQHKTMKQYADCEQCQVNRMKRTSLMREMGFKSIPQYLEWKKIMEVILLLNKLNNGNKRGNKKSKK